MSRLDSTILDLEESARDLQDFADDFSPDPQTSSLANALFGSARQRLANKGKSALRRDSPTLPWRSPSLRKTTREGGKENPEPQAATRPERPDSPDIQTILSKTPRPRKSSSTTFSGSISSLSSRSQSSSNLRKTPTPPKDDESLISDSTLLELDSDFEDGGSESDSSLDIHTPLPHLMFRDGLLSPRSKLLPQDTSPFSHEDVDAHSLDRSRSVLSLASTTGSVMTGLQKDPRDTERRRLRHKDGRLLRAGMGLTTGLGWSDSEDEDAPSPLTRKLIHSTIDRQRSDSVNSSRLESVYEGGPSRLTSPVPSRLGMSRKDSSFSSLRSASVSIPKAASGPGTGLRMPRGRAVSAAGSGASSTFSIPSEIASPPLGMRRLPSSSSLGQTNSTILANRSFAESPVPEISPTIPTTKIRPPQERPRAESSASNASIAPAMSHEAPPSSLLSRSPTPRSPVPRSPSPAVKPAGPRIPRSRSGSTNSSASAAAAPSAARPRRPPTESTVPSYNAPSSVSIPRIPRPRTESTTSDSTTTTTSQASSASLYSQNSSSTASSGSTVPRPLRLPQTAAMNHTARSFSQDTTSEFSRQNRPGPAYQRARTFSNPQSSFQLPISPTQIQVRTTSNSLSSGVLPPGAPPTLRERQAPNGARPRPRTGTGMVYRTASSSMYASFHESGSKMRGLTLTNYSQKGVPI